MGYPLQVMITKPDIPRDEFLHEPEFYFQGYMPETIGRLTRLSNYRI